VAEQQREAGAPLAFALPRPRRQQVAEATEVLARLLCLLDTVHGSTANAQAIEDVFADSFGSASPLVGMGDETSSARVAFGRILDDLEAVGFNVNRVVDRNHTADRMRYRLSGVPALDPAISSTEREALEAVSRVASAMVAGTVRMMLDDSNKEPAVEGEHGAAASLHVLTGAIRQRKVVDFAYGTGERREIHPYAITLGPSGQWFVGGWCRHTESIRTFPIDVLRDIREVPKRTYRDAEPSDTDDAAVTNPLLWDVSDPIVCELKLASTATTELLEALELDASLTSGDIMDGTMATVMTGNPKWMLHLVMAHWPHVRLTGPEPLVARLVDRLTILGRD